MTQACIQPSVPHAMCHSRMMVRRIRRVARLNCVARQSHTSEDPIRGTSSRVSNRNIRRDLDISRHRPVALRSRTKGAKYIGDPRIRDVIWNFGDPSVAGLSYTGSAVPQSHNASHPMSRQCTESWGDFSVAKGQSDQTPLMLGRKTRLPTGL